MQTIINNTYFINDLDIPNSKPVAGGANNASKLTDCIKVIERSLLLNALGLEIYNELQAALPIVEESENKWKWLVNGKEYDNKVWEGLASPKSLIAYAVYTKFLEENSTFWTTFGIVKPEADNSNNFTPAFKVATAWQKFRSKYQNGCVHKPYREYIEGALYTDWYGDFNDVEVSLYQYLRDSKELYGWDESKFKFYEQINSFGL